MSFGAIAERSGEASAKTRNRRRNEICGTRLSLEDDFPFFVLGKYSARRATTIETDEDRHVTVYPEAVSLVQISSGEVKRYL